MGIKNLGIVGDLVGIFDEVVFLMEIECLELGMGIEYILKNIDK
ncbi:hypothetical protein T260_04445 [Geobacillus thermopakistaniensis]|uniref:Uncharacterized protein n=1 Tax=Geobacillus thermopakistaniensis (strain MAS1) TaxID=1408282 RepID=A0A7U9P6Y7_GEOTM|nr:hypothetical protein T260_04445 [Geobacillus sp. MAS1]